MLCDVGNTISLRCEPACCDRSLGFLLAAQLPTAYSRGSTYLMRCLWSGMQKVFVLRTCAGAVPLALHLGITCFAPHLPAFIRCLGNALPVFGPHTGGRVVQPRSDLDGSLQRGSTDLHRKPLLSNRFLCQSDLPCTY